jgi:hypothetical protein
MSLFSKIYNFFSGYLLAIILLTFLLVLTYFGTMAQVEMGLYEASDKYFESLFLVQEVGSSFHIFSYEIGPLNIVLPGVYLVSALLFVNLFLGGLVRAKKNWRRPGMVIAHFGIIYILFAGFVAFHYTREGNMVLYEGDSSDEIYNLTEWSIEISNYDSDGMPVKTYVVGPEDLYGIWDNGAKKTFHNPQIPFEIDVSGYKRNIANGKGQLMGLLKKEAAKEKYIRVVEDYGLVNVPTNKNMEFNLPAAYFDFKTKEGDFLKEGLIIGSGPFSPKPFTLEVNQSTWSVDLTRQKHTLPFGVKLTKFQKEDHPGTARAREYSSDVIKIDDGKLTDKVHISMNKPMRDSGYTLYQASWGPEGAKPGDKLYTSLAVSYNPADQWPKYGTYVISIGMTIHFVQRLLNYLKRNSRSRKKKEKLI